MDLGDALRAADDPCRDGCREGGADPHDHAGQRMGLARRQVRCAQVPDHVALANQTGGQAAHEVGLVEPGLDDVGAKSLQSPRQLYGDQWDSGFSADILSAVTGMPDDSSRGASAPRSSRHTTFWSNSSRKSVASRTSINSAPPVARLLMTWVMRSRERASGGTGWLRTDPAVDVLVTAGSEDARPR